MLLEGRDRALLNALLLGTLRNLTLLDHWIGQLRQGRIRPDLRRILRIGLYQVLPNGNPQPTLRSTRPSHSPTPRSERAIANAVLRRAQRTRSDLLAESKPPPARDSLLPSKIPRRGAGAVDSEIKIHSCSVNGSSVPAPVYLRANDLVAGARETLANFADPFPADTRFFRCEGAPPVNALARGLCYIQDPSTALACDLLAPEPGERVLDACAAPGGKTSLLAAMMENRGKILACDADPKRLETLASNLQRLGVAIAKTRSLDWSAGATAAAPEELDAILIDVPCSNTGVMRRRVDLRWRLTPGTFEKMQNRQELITVACLPLLAPGGRLVYSTCSLEPEENEAVVDALLAADPSLRCEEQRWSTPFENGVDGAFAALIRRR